MKKITTIALGLIMSALLFQSVGLAANPYYAFNVKNTGQKFTVDLSSTNNKVYTNRGWTLYVSSIKNIKGAGISFVPCRYISGSWKVSGKQMFRKTTNSSAVHGTYGSGQAVKDSYNLGGRPDDAYTYSSNALPGASGTWNADT